MQFIIRDTAPTENMSSNVAPNENMTSIIAPAENMTSNIAPAENITSNEISQNMAQNEFAREGISEVDISTIDNVG